ncbi:hypothetical protein Gotri_026491 [Gossypium trilobum]|uniref:Uncharacterized protein n=1 Tax=Gossypium trilobum TaxID=34281 RepID=A0A7J9FW56_9ROSI|nr:hypothetical protein [Gossypium trilobum]
MGRYWICPSTCIKTIYVEVVYTGNARVDSVRFYVQG